MPSLASLSLTAVLMLLVAPDKVGAGVAGVGERVGERVGGPMPARTEATESSWCAMGGM